MTLWICSKCGDTGATALLSRPSLDDRYAVGWCERCTPADPPPAATKPNAKPWIRATVPLVREDVWDPAVLAERRQRAYDERVMKGKVDGKAADDHKAALRARWAREAQERRAAGG